MPENESEDSVEEYEGEDQPAAAGVAQEAKQTTSSETEQDESEGKAESGTEQSPERVVAVGKKKHSKEELSPEEQAEMERRQKVIEEREIIEVDPEHVSQELIPEGKQKVLIGPPILTRFEKARILAARALQLSLGAPPFIGVPEGVATSLDLAYAELEKRVIPITVRRTLPTSDYQNIPLDYFD